MTDLHELLYESWCSKCSKPFLHTHPKPEDWVVPTSPLATRLPECVPPGLEWHNIQFSQEGQWMLWERRPCGGGSGQYITDEQAELLCIGKWVKVLSEPRTDTSTLEIRFDGELWHVLSPGTDSYGSGNSRIAALAAALHRLADEREAMKA